MSSRGFRARQASRAGDGCGPEPLILERMLYFKDEMFKGMFDQRGRAMRLAM